MLVPQELGPARDTTEIPFCFHVYLPGSVPALAQTHVPPGTLFWSHEEERNSGKLNQTFLLLPRRRQIHVCNQIKVQVISQTGLCALY